MMEPKDHLENHIKVERCKVCEDVAYERTYGFPICSVCKLLTLRYLKCETVHKPCCRNKKCISSKTDLNTCPCCFLGKCANLVMGPYNAMWQELNDAFRKSFPYFPCPTCTPNTFRASNTHGEKSSQCEVCEDLALGIRYSARVCQACATFFSSQVKSDNAHRQCKFNQQCIITKENRRCACCRLKKCLAVGMDPVGVKGDTKAKINHNLFVDRKPKEWIFFFPCKTCDSERISVVNQLFQDLKPLFMKVKKESTISSAASIEEETADAIELENDHANCLEPSDSAVPTYSISDDNLIKTNLYFEDPVLLHNDETGYISNSTCSGGESGGFDDGCFGIFRGSSRLATTVVNHDQRNLSLSPPPGEWEGISPIDITDESAIEQSYMEVSTRF